MVGGPSDAGCPASVMISREIAVLHVQKKTVISEPGYLCMPLTILFLYPET